MLRFQIDLFFFVMLNLFLSFLFFFSPVYNKSILMFICSFRFSFGTPAAQMCECDGRNCPSVSLFGVWNDRDWRDDLTLSTKISLLEITTGGQTKKNMKKWKKKILTDRWKQMKKNIFALFLICSFHEMRIRLPAAICNNAHLTLSQRRYFFYVFVFFSVFLMKSDTIY